MHRLQDAGGGRQPGFQRDTHPPRPVISAPSAARHSTALSGSVWLFLGPPAHRCRLGAWRSIPAPRRQSEFHSSAAYKQQHLAGVECVVLAEVSDLAADQGVATVDRNPVCGGPVTEVSQGQVMDIWRVEPLVTQARGDRHPSTGEEVGAYLPVAKIWKRDNPDLANSQHRAPAP